MNTLKPASGLRSLLPAAEWLPGYERRWLKSDVIAGVTLAAYAIRVSMACAPLAGLPPQHGIYCCLLGGLCYAAFGTIVMLANIVRRQFAG